MMWKMGVAGVLLFAGICTLGGCRGDEQSKTGEARALPEQAVTIADVKEVIAKSRVEVVGTVEAVEKASISARVAGQIIDLPVVLGSRVKKGDLLVKISAGEISAKVLQAEAQLSQARRNLTREKKLQKKGASTQETVKSLTDAVRIAEAINKEVGTMLEYTTITAPFSGTVTKKIANTGDLASPGIVLLQIENGQSLQVLARVPEVLLLQVNVGDTLAIRIPAANVILDGKVAEVAPSADPMSRTAAVKINIPAGTNIRVGQFARVKLEGRKESTLVIPHAAVVPKGQMDLVYVAEGKTARMRLVRTGAAYGDEVEILSGLEAGEQVVVGGAMTLQDGQPLKFN